MPVENKHTHFEKNMEGLSDIREVLIIRTPTISELFKSTGGESYSLHMLAF